MSIFPRANFFLLLAVAASGFFGCGGGGSNNDQGTSFLALGYFPAPVPGSTAVPSVALTAAVLPLGSDRLNPSLFGGEGSLLFASIGLQNRLTRQYIRAQRVDCSYEVQGSDPSLVIPSDSVSTSFVLGPQASSTGTSSTSSSSSGGVVTPQVFFMTVDIITTDIFAFLNANRNLLPELPFNMTVTCSVVGITQSGKVLTTNPVNLDVIVVEAVSGFPAPATGGVRGNGPGNGTGNGPGTGGTIGGGAGAITGAGSIDSISSDTGDSSSSISTDTGDSSSSSSSTSGDSSQN